MKDTLLEIDYSNLAADTVFPYRLMYSHMQLLRNILITEVDAQVGLQNPSKNAH